MARMSEVSLRPITDENRAAVLALDVTDLQHNYVAGVEESLEDARDTPQAMPWYRAIYAGDEPVGFVMISDNIPEPMDADLVGPYYLWKLFIDHRFQRRGYGTATLDAVVDYLRTRPGADVLYTSCADGPGSPRGFYLRYGFTDTGRVMWGENVLALDLAPRRSTTRPRR